MYVRTFNLMCGGNEVLPCVDCVYGVKGKPGVFSLDFEGCSVCVVEFSLRDTPSQHKSIKVKQRGSEK